jgi:hypothetical protein
VCLISYHVGIVCLYVSLRSIFQHKPSLIDDYYAFEREHAHRQANIAMPDQIPCRRVW